MGAVQLPDELKQVIDRQVSLGRAVSEAAFLAEAVQRYAEALELEDYDDDEAVLAAADEGIADIEAGRFRLISGPEDLQRFFAELRAEWHEAIEVGEPPTP